jgi:7-carboxy-7-deazaguanine synthase
VDELVHQCTGLRHVVITGGEPCLYDLVPLTGLLLSIGHTVQIETSGTHEVRCDARTWVTVSPKVDMPGGFVVLATAVQRADEIKFPVGKSADMNKLLPLLRHKRNDVPVYVQPLSQSPKATEVCKRIAMERNFRLSIQTHKYVGLR